MSKETIQFLALADTHKPEKIGVNSYEVFVPNLNEDFMKEIVSHNLGQPVRWGVIGVPPEDPKNPKPNEGLSVYIAPGEDFLIPLKIKAKLPGNVGLRIAPLPGVSAKTGIQVDNDFIDSSIKDELYVHVVNSSSMLKFLSFGQPIAKLVPEVISDVEAEVAYDEKLKDSLAKSVPEADYKQLKFIKSEDF